MIVDIIIIVILVAFLVVGLFRNPIKCAIDLVLFIAFTFIFYNVLVGLQDTILNSAGLSMSQIGEAKIGDSIASANTSLQDLAKQLEITLLGIDENLTSNELYVQVGYAVVHCIFFVVSSIISIILAYGIGWGIYAIFRKKVKNIKKLPKMILGATASLLIGCSFIMFTFSPVYLLTDNTAKVLSYVENENLENIVTFLNNTEEKAMKYSDDIDKVSGQLEAVNAEVNSYESTIQEFDTNINDLVARYNDIGNRLDSLSKKFLSTEDRYIVEQAQKKHKEYQSKVDEATSEFAKTKKEYYDLKNEINGYASQTGDLGVYLVTLSEVTNTVNEYYNEIKIIGTDYKQYIPSIFNFLGKINFGCANVNTTASEIKDLNGFFDVLDKSLDSLINEDSVKLIQAGNAKIDELIETFEKYKTQLDDFENQYDTYKADIDKQIEDGRNQIDEANNELDKYEVELERLEAKYN